MFTIILGKNYASEILTIKRAFSTQTAQETQANAQLNGILLCFFHLDSLEFLRAGFV